MKTLLLLLIASPICGYSQDLYHFKVDCAVRKDDSNRIPEYNSFQFDRNFFSTKDTTYTVAKVEFDPLKREYLYYFGDKDIYSVGWYVFYNAEVGLLTISYRGKKKTYVKCKK